MNKSTVVGVGAAVAYRNPWWADPRDPLRDRRIVDAAVAVECAREERRRRSVHAWVVGLTLVVVDAVLFAQWINAADANNDAGDAYGAPFGVVLLIIVVFPFAAWGYAVASVRRPVDAMLAELAQRSRSDYNSWLAHVHDTDVSLYGQIVNWYQQQDLIEAQRRTAQMAALTAAAAWRIAANTHPHRRVDGHQR